MWCVVLPEPLVGNECCGSLKNLKDEKTFYGTITGICINILLVSLMSIAYDGDPYLWVVDAIVIICGSFLGLRIGDKFL